MKHTPMLPYRFKFAGLLLVCIGFPASIAVLFYEWEWSVLSVRLPHWLPGVDGSIFQPSKNNLTDELAFTLTLLGLLIACFSREKQEDEFIQHTRLVSLQWAVIVHYTVLLLATWIIYNENFWYVIIAAMLTIPIIFLARFHWILYRNQSRQEEAL